MQEMQMFPFPPQYNRVAQREFVSKSYRIRFTGFISSNIEDYADILALFEEATERDVIYMQIHSPGGDLDTCDFICRRMSECEARIVAEIGMTCASGATMIALHADDWVVADSSIFMVHSCSYSPGWGKESDIRLSAEVTARLNREFIERTYTGFLTEKEMHEVLEYGQDKYFFAAELRERLEAFALFRDGDDAETAATELGEEEVDPR